MESRMDMINGSLGDKIIRYALPLAVTGVLQQLFNCLLYTSDAADDNGSV